MKELKFIQIGVFKKLIKFLKKNLMFFDTVCLDYGMYYSIQYVVYMIF